MAINKGAAWDTPSRREARRRTRDGEGFIYLAGCKSSDTLKIGFSLHPERRVRQLGRGTFLICKVPGTYRQERKLHGKLVEHSIDRSRICERYRPSVLSHPAIPAELRSAA